jgi:F-type H+-transporting ATPase subunit b
MTPSCTHLAGASLKSVPDQHASCGLTQKRALCYRKDCPFWGSAFPLFMDKLLNDLGGIVLNALPTSIIVLILAIFVKQFYLKPLEAVLAERHRLTEGARLAAEESHHAADSKIAAYEAALEKARGEIYASQTEFLRNLHAEQAARAQTAKAASDSTLAAVRQSLAVEAAEARESLAAQSDQLASEIATSVLSHRTRKLS